jgi:VanZ family protein
MSSKAVKISALLYAIVFLTILILAYTGNLPTQLELIPNSDKVGHVILYAIATYLGHCLFGYRRLRNGLPIFPLLFTILTVVEEAVQGFSPNRTLDAIDLVMSLVGIGLGYQLAEKGNKRRC